MGSAPPLARATTRALPIALLRARETVMGPIRNMLADAGVTEQQWRVLRVLDERGVTDATDIARSACLLMPSLTRILQVLEEKQLCSRSPHPTDRRRALIEITPKGRALLAENLPQTNQIYKEIEAKLGPDRLEQLLDLLADLVEEE
jgi:homoprotocatechuate degradation regulator HpaR